MYSVDGVIYNIVKDYNGNDVVRFFVYYFMKKIVYKNL